MEKRDIYVIALTISLAIMLVFSYLLFTEYMNLYYRHLAVCYYFMVFDRDLYQTFKCFEYLK